MNKKLILITTLLSLLTIGTRSKINTYVTAKENIINIMSNSDFIINNGVLVKYTGSEANVVIPEGVKEIRESAFSECTSLKSIEIPVGVKEIKNSTFFNCKNLKNIEFSEGLEKIGSYVFSSCTNLKSIKIPKSVNEISKEAFFKYINFDNDNVENLDITIEGYSGSYAEKYAKENNIKFMIINID